MVLTIAELNNVPLAPPPPEDIYFSEGRKAWIVSRYRDVLAAVKSTDLNQTGPEVTPDCPQVRPDSAMMRAQMLSAIGSTHGSNWQLQVSGFASATLRSLARYRSVDLMRQFIRPWCLASAVTLSHIDPVHILTLKNLLS